jgi:hypothetical protein
MMNDFLDMLSDIFSHQGNSDRKPCLKACAADAVHGVQARTFFHKAYLPKGMPSYWEKEINAQV